MPVKSDWFSIVYSSLFSVGFFVLLIALITSNTAAMIAGYCILVVAVVLMASYLYNVMSTGSSGLSFLFTALMNLGPFIVILGILLYSLSLTIIYMNPINNQHVSEQYYTFSTLSTLFILSQLLFLAYGVKTPQFQQRKQLSGLYCNFIYMTGVINIYLLITINTILSKYITDG